VVKGKYKSKVEKELNSPYDYDGVSAAGAWKRSQAI
jgi:hypothetical protein